MAGSKKTVHRKFFGRFVPGKVFGLYASEHDRNGAREHRLFKSRSDVGVGPDERPGFFFLEFNHNQHRHHRYEQLQNAPYWSATSVAEKYSFETFGALAGWFNAEGAAGLGLSKVD